MSELRGMTGDLPGLRSLFSKYEDSNEWATYNEGFWLKEYCEGALDALKQHDVTQSFFNTTGVMHLEPLDDEDFVILNNNLGPEEEDIKVPGTAQKELDILESLDDSSGYHVAAYGAATKFPLAVFFPGWNIPLSGALQHLTTTREGTAEGEPVARPVVREAETSKQSACEVYQDVLI